MSHLVSDIIAKRKSIDSMNSCEIRSNGFERTHVTGQFVYLNRMKKHQHMPQFVENRNFRARTCRSTQCPSMLNDLLSKPQPDQIRLDFHSTSFTQGQHRHPDTRLPRGCAGEDRVFTAGGRKRLFKFSLHKSMDERAFGAGA
jgi:hypothetical protein